MLIPLWHGALGPLQRPQGEPGLPGNPELPIYTARNTALGACQGRLFFCELAGHRLHSAAQGSLGVPVSGAVLSPKALVVPLRKTTHSEVGRLMRTPGLLETPAALWPCAGFLEPWAPVGVPWELRLGPGTPESRDPPPALLLSCWVISGKLPSLSEPLSMCMKWRSWLGS